MSPIVQLSSGELHDAVREICYDPIEFKMPKSYKLVKDVDSLYPSCENSTSSRKVLLEKLNKNQAYGRFGGRLEYMDDSVFVPYERKMSVKETVKKMVKEIGKDKTIKNLGQQVETLKNGIHYRNNTISDLNEIISRLRLKLKVHEDYLAVMKGNLR